MARSKRASAFSTACWHFPRSSSAWTRGTVTKNESAIATTPAAAVLISLDFTSFSFNGLLVLSRQYFLFRPLADSRNSRNSFVEFAIQDILYTLGQNAGDSERLCGKKLIGAGGLGLLQ